jgi:hypothetical protein
LTIKNQLARPLDSCTGTQIAHTHSSYHSFPFTLVQQFPLHPRTTASPSPSYHSFPFTLAPQLPLHPRTTASPSPSYHSFPFTLLPQLPLHPRTTASPSPSYHSFPFTLVPHSRPLVMMQELQPDNLKPSNLSPDQEGPSKSNTMMPTCCTGALSSGAQRAGYLHGMALLGGSGLHVQSTWSACLVTVSHSFAASVQLRCMCRGLGNLLCMVVTQVRH